MDLPRIIPHRNAVEEIYQEAKARLGDPLGARESGASGFTGSPPPPSFEATENEAGDFIDMFLTEEDLTESTTELTTP